MATDARQIDTRVNEEAERAAPWLAMACAAATPVSIAASQILLGAAILATVLARARWRIAPAIAWPLGLFVGGTVISLLFSGDIAGGLPQIRKMYVLLLIPIIYMWLRTGEQARRIVLAWCAAGALGSLWGLMQFLRKWREANELGRDFYQFYIGDRMTGFQGHWMTLGGVQMLVLLMTAAVLLYAAPKRRAWLLWAGAAVIGMALVLGFTRGIWIATFAGTVWLVLRWHWKLVFALPLLAGALWLAGPDSLRQRAVSIATPRGTMDSNQHRIVTWRTGLRMIQAHPLLGLGPEQVGKQFKQYVPADTPELPTGWYGHLHNIYLQYAAERGIPVMLAMVWLLAGSVAIWWRAAAAASGAPRAILEGAMAALLAILVGGVFEHNLGDSEPLMLFCVILSLGYRAAEYAKEQAHA